MSLDLAKIEAQLDAALDCETAESLHEWLNTKRKQFAGQQKLVNVDQRVMLKIAEAYNKGKEDAVTETIKQLENYIKTGNIDFISVSLGWVEKRLRKALKQSNFST